MPDVYIAQHDVHILANSYVDEIIVEVVAVAIVEVAAGAIIKQYPVVHPAKHAVHKQVSHHSL